MALQIDTSTIQSAQRRLDVISNNISNSNTVGFKTSNFEQVIGSAFAQTQDVSRAGAVQNFSQGNLTESSNPLDIAINGSGFFRFESNADTVYSRNGQFTVNKEGYVVNGNGDKLTGYLAKAGDIDKSALKPLMIVSGDQYAPEATANINLRTTLDCRKTVPGSTFNSANPDSYNDTTTISVHDAKGTPLTLQAYFVKTTAGWDLHLFKDGSEVTSPAIAMEFSANGSLSKVKGVAVDTGLGKADVTIGTQTISLNLKDTAAYSAPFSSVMTFHDGVELGTLNSYKVQEDGTLIGSYTNGKQKTLGQVVLANFTNSSALAYTINNQWKATDGSGSAQIYVPGVEGTGTLKGFTTEDSNVDLSGEMIKLIAAQRAFQSAAEVVKREDETLQTLVNIGR